MYLLLYVLVLSGVRLASSVSSLQFLFGGTWNYEFSFYHCFLVSLMFSYDVSFSLNSKISFHFFFISSLTNLSLCRALFFFHVYVYFPCFCWNLRPALVHGVLIGCLGLFQSSQICWVLICDQLEWQFSRRCLRCWGEGIFFCFSLNCYTDIC